MTRFEVIQIKSRWLWKPYLVQKVYVSLSGEGWNSRTNMKRFHRLTTAETYAMGQADGTWIDIGQITSSYTQLGTPLVPETERTPTDEKHGHPDD
jgi:hypothetical protein